MEFTVTHHPDGFQCTVREGDDSPAVFDRRELGQPDLHESSNDTRGEHLINREAQCALRCGASLREGSDARDHATTEGKEGVVMGESLQPTDDRTPDFDAVDVVLTSGGSARQAVVEQRPHVFEDSSLCGRRFGETTTLRRSHVRSGAEPAVEAVGCDDVVACELVDVALAETEKR